jgi:hypothetical protein
VTPSGHDIVPVAPARLVVVSTRMLITMAVVTAVIIVAAFVAQLLVAR